MIKLKAGDIILATTTQNVYVWGVGSNTVNILSSDLSMELDCFCWTPPKSIKSAIERCHEHIKLFRAGNLK